MARFVYCLAVFAAAVPFVGWILPAGWLAAMLALGALNEVWRARVRAGRAAEDGVNPVEWLGSVGYSAAACYLIFFYTGAAQTFGIALLSVVLFRILARDYASPSRMAINLIPSLAALALVQCGAIAYRLLNGHPFQVLTVLAGPYIVFLTFRSVQTHLARSLAAERSAKQKSELAAREISDAHRIAVMAEELAGIGQWRLDAKTMKSSWSQSVYQTLGLDRAAGEPDLDTVIEMLDPADGEDLSEKIARALNHGTPFDCEVSLRRRNGAVRILKGNAAAERDGEGKVATVFGVFMDVTEARTDQALLRQSEAQFRLLADHSTDLVIWLTLDGTIQYVSPSIRNFGYEPEQILGRKTLEFVHPDDRERTVKMLMDEFQGGSRDGAIRREYRVLSGHGVYVWLEGNPTIIYNEEGVPTSVVTTYRDVSQRRQLEDDLMAAKDKAEAAAEAKSQFLANMSHEIRTPLTAIIGFAGLLRDGDLPAERVKTYVDRIEAGGRSLLSVVNDILDFSKLEAGQVQLDPHAFAPVDVISQSLDLFAAEAAAKGIEVGFVAESEMPAYIEADGARLQQVLNNLLSNAIKFTERGAVTIAAGYDPASSILTISVADTGVGVPPDKLGGLFQRFSQVDGSVSRRFGGTGLGLSICKTLVELMGGDIGVTSQQGAGSRFTLSIPAPIVVIQDETVAALEPTLADDCAVAKILVVDDLDANRELVRAILGAMGHEVFEAAGGEDAVAATCGEVFDLILMDLQMPGMDGFAAARMIRRASGPNQDTPILALSANVLSEHVQASAEAGMNGHLGKPIVPRELVVAVASWAGRRVDCAAQPALSDVAVG